MQKLTSIIPIPFTCVSKLQSIAPQKAMNIRLFACVLPILFCTSNSQCADNRADKKIVIAVTQVKTVGLDQEQGQLAIDAISNKIQSVQIYTVIERNQIAEILKEQSFQQSGACEQSECAVEVGKLLGAQKLITGSIGVFPGLINTNLKVVDVSTGAVERSYSDTRRGDFAALLLDVLPEAAAKLSGISENAEVFGSFLLDPRDSKAYKLFKFKNLAWMAENLNFKTNNSICYENDTSNCRKFGSLYNLKDALQACPSGWHLSTDADWKILENDAGIKDADFSNTVFSRGSVAQKFMSTTGWRDNFLNNLAPKELIQGTDDYGFKAMPAGISSNGNKFSFLGYSTWFWAKGGKSNELCYRNISASSTDIPRMCFQSGESKMFISIRCVRDIQ